jgi:hypothetical protein
MFPAKKHAFSIIHFSTLTNQKGCPQWLTWDRCYDFKNIFAEKNCKKLAFLTQSKAKLCKILIITLVF